MNTRNNILHCKKNITLSELSQTQKNIYHIVSFI